MFMLKKWQWFPLIKYYGYGVQRHFQQNFSYIEAVSFSGGGNRRTWRKPLTCHKLYHIMLCRVHITWAGFELTFSMGIGTDCISSCKFNYMYHTITTAPNILMNKVLKILCKGIALYPTELLQPKLHYSWLVERSPNYTSPDWWRESLEDTKGVIESRKVKKGRQCNRQRNKEKRTNNEL